ncbi:unnamed protein product [Cylicocyclus nassatus]|uniref:Uncharacterized protein n=1 Tax=Cylicocyclus nassatus TaxID=53992 RepID=A0AA36GJA2_CYLNA|nr:unnamed protein product [Cylicocyclus nassatus]
MQPYAGASAPMNTKTNVKQILRCMEDNYGTSVVSLIRMDFLDYPQSPFGERSARLAAMRQNIPQRHNSIVDHMDSGRNNNSKWLGAEADRAVNLDEVYRQVENADSRRGEIICNFVTALLIQSYNPEKWDKLYVRAQPGRCYIVDNGLIARFLMEVDIRNNNRLQNTYSGNVTECM